VCSAQTCFLFDEIETLGAFCPDIFDELDALNGVNDGRTCDHPKGCIDAIRCIWHLFTLLETDHQIDLRSNLTAETVGFQDPTGKMITYLILGVEGAAAAAL
jgi:hypothetical protein